MSHSPGPWQWGYPCDLTESGRESEGGLYDAEGQRIGIEVDDYAYQKNILMGKVRHPHLRADMEAIRSVPEMLALLRRFAEGRHIWDDIFATRALLDRIDKAGT